MLFSWPRAIVVTVISLGLWVAFEAYTHNTLEDALITFRFAENWSQGFGFSFVPNKWVQGTTTPVYTLLLTFLGLVLGPEFIWPSADIINLFAGGGCALITAAILLRLGASNKDAYLSIPLLLCGPSMLWSGTGGMETILVLFWMALSTLLALQGRFIWAAVTVALLVLTRLDGLIWGGLLFLYALKEAPKKSMIGAGIALCLIGPWFIWAWSVFGNPLPHSILAKSLIRPESLNVSIFDPAYILKWAKHTLPQWGSISAGIPIGLIAFGYGAYGFVQNKSRFGWVLISFSLIFPFVFFIRKAPYFPWYVLPIYWSGFVIGMMGLSQIRKRLERPVYWYSLLLCLLVCFGARDAKKFYEFKLLQENEDSLRTEVGKWLHQNTPENAQVAMEAIGYQGYFAHRPVLDIAGLVSPEMLDLVEGPYQGGAVFGRMIKELKPEYIVLRGFEVSNNEHFHGGPLFVLDGDRQYFEHHYKTAKVFLARHQEFWGDQSKVILYERQNNN